ncbi:MAG: dTDP-glucose 4,6-dehydratase [Betaproteobacteria bacterium RIFCSPLOWO2_02_FULL_62_17]|nr:MAG: dTDP-glucose 4,6-dehydratase [Betaproteobacteria bacterium RIFCSPLOWO2_02_FULL_62_17]
MTILVTGGAGFIGSNFVLDWLAQGEEPVVTLDKLTYAGNLANLARLQNDPRHTFVRGDICDRPLVARMLATHRVRAVLHFAAESHVDRSIHGPSEFVQTNLVGTFSLLEEVRAHWNELSGARREGFRFLHVSTDEVYGSLQPGEPAFTETRAYSPNSPYSASKAGSDHLVRAYYHTYGLPVLTSNCSNNYGPMQFPEKLIPLMILNALEQKPLPVYGDGGNVRDWLHVGDHCEALRSVLTHGRPGETYNVGGSAECTNLQVVNTLCELLDRLSPRTSGRYSELIKFVTDRPGHDRRYAIDATKIRRELKWTPRHSFATGLEQTVRWYLENRAWVENIRSGEYQRWIDKNYLAR